MIQSTLTLLLDKFYDKVKMRMIRAKHSIFFPCVSRVFLCLYVETSVISTNQVFLFSWMIIYIIAFVA